MGLNDLRNAILWMHITAGVHKIRQKLLTFFIWDFKYTTYALYNIHVQKPRYTYIHVQCIVLHLLVDSKYF